MIDDRILQLQERLVEFIVEHFVAEELSRLLYFKMKGFDFMALAPGQEFDDRVFRFVLLVTRKGQLNWLTEVVVEERKTVHGVAALIEAMQPLAAAHSPGPVQPAGEWQMDGRIASFVQFFQGTVKDMAASPARTELLKRLSNDIRNHSDGWEELPDRLHLSDSAGERCAVILSLEKDPCLKYSRWLAERVLVEEEVAGQMAAQALTCASLLLPLAELEGAETAVQEALDLLRGVPNVVFRKKELRLAQEAIERRRQRTLAAFPALELDTLLSSITTAFPRNALISLCEKPPLNCSLPLTVNLHAPDVHVVFSLVRMAEEAGWAKSLICEAAAARPDHAGLAKIRKQVGNPE